jgi:hypothetical protein
LSEGDQEAIANQLQRVVRRWLADQQLNKTNTVATSHSTPQLTSSLARKHGAILRAEASAAHFGFRAMQDMLRQEWRGEHVNRTHHRVPATAAIVSDLPRIVAFRNVLIHDYATIGDLLVWEAATTRIDLLIATLSRLLSEGQTT